MKKIYQKSLFLFRRDLRLQDNTGLIQAVERSDVVIPAFNFDPIQIGAKNKYRSMNALQYMIGSLQDLNGQLKTKKGRLYLFYGPTAKTVSAIIKHEKIGALFINRDYTPFSKKRDQELEKICKNHRVAFHTYDDALLIGSPEHVINSSGKPYTRYTPFYRQARKISVAKPVPLSRNAHFFTKAIAGEGDFSICKEIVPTPNPNLKVPGGTRHARKILQKMKDFKGYNKDRNFPAIDATTHLSAAHKFGTISIRESYHAIKKIVGSSSQLIPELYWRDFFTAIIFHFPHVIGNPLHEKYKRIPWSKNKKQFTIWCAGKTGFPFVDAGMRQMNATGWMHNRARMVAASFLIKDLHIDWRVGEQYFATQLVDYDPAVNNQNWQWVASTGADAQPYFRIFNPWLQQKKFDPDCAYIKQWIPELKDIPITIIHQWYKYHPDYQETGYPAPLVDHDTEKKKTLQLYKKI